MGRWNFGGLEAESLLWIPLRIIELPEVKMAWSMRHKVTVTILARGMRTPPGNVKYFGCCAFNAALCPDKLSSSSLPYADGVVIILA